MDIYYFVDQRGHNPVKEFIHGLPFKEQEKIYAYIDELRQQGHNLRRPMADYLRDGIYELRPKTNRVLYFFFLTSGVVLVHAIRKKTDKIPEQDLTLAIRRKSEVEENQNIEKL
jgi:phage-related protein